MSNMYHVDFLHVDGAAVLGPMFDPFSLQES